MSRLSGDGTRRSSRSVTGRVCVVTGASSGLGRRTALDLAAAGNRVCVAARREQRLATLVEEMGGEGAGHSYVVTDVSDRAQVKALVEHVRNNYGRIEVLVNNAGFAGKAGFSGPDSVADIERVMATNFFGAVYCTAEFLPLLETSAPSHVVNVASMAGRLATPGVPTYVASKFALVGWTESLYPELAQRGVYLSSVEPGFIPTEGFPQKNMTQNKLMKYLLGTDSQVSDAIQDAIVNRRPQRVVPRWYYLAQLPRVLSPGLYRFGLERLMKSSLGRRARDFR